MLQRLREINWFKPLSMAAGLLYFYLFVELFFMPDAMCRDFGLPAIESVYFIERRISMLMLGFAAFLFFSRNAGPSPWRNAVSGAVSLNMTGFAATGIHEYAKGCVGDEFLVIAAVELLTAGLFFAVVLADWKTRKEI